MHLTPVEIPWYVRYQLSHSYIIKHITAKTPGQENENSET